jgi:hypothetical protein
VNPSDGRSRHEEEVLTCSLRVAFPEMLEATLFASVRFHDTTSRGRLLNRFGKDMEGGECKVKSGEAWMSRCARAHSPSFSLPVDSSLADNLGKTLIYGLNVSVTFVSIAGKYSAPCSTQTDDLTCSLFLPSHSRRRNPIFGRCFLPWSALL